METRWRRGGLLTYAVIALFGFALYGATLTHDYALDDAAVIVTNRYTQEGLAGIHKLLTTPYWAGKDDTFQNSYRPLSLVSFAIEKELFGNSPLVGHAVNVLLYSLTGVLLCVVLERLLGRDATTVTLLATLLFVAHPIHTEVVANIKSRDELLAFALCLLTIVSAQRYVTTKSGAAMAIAGSSFFLALMSKESAIMFLVVVPLTLYFFSHARPREVLKAGLLLVPGTVLYSLLRAYSLTTLLGMQTRGFESPLNNALLAAEGLAEHTATALLLLGKYVVLFLVPYPLAYDYSIGQITIVGFDQPGVLLVAGSVLTAGLYAVTTFRRKSLVSYSILYFLITYSITSNLFVLVVGATMAERFMYAPSLGFCLLLGFALTRFDDWTGRLLPVRRLALVTIAGLLLVAYSGLTVVRSSVWKNMYTLVSHDIRRVPGNPRMVAHFNTCVMALVGNEKNEETRRSLLEESIRVLENSLRVYESQPSEREHLGAAVYYALGNFYRESGEFSTALSSYDKAILLDPTNHRAHLYQGMILDRQKEYRRAIDSYRRAIENKLGYDVAFYNLGNTYARLQDYESAASAYEKAIEANPTYAKAFGNLGIMLRQLGDEERAERMIDEAIRLDPTLADQLR